MASCEHSRTRAYDEDLRWRIVYQHYALEYSNVRIADNMNIDSSTVSRILSLFEETGDVEKRPHPCGQAHHQQKLTTIDQLFIIQVVLDRPGVYLHELRQCLLMETGTSVSESTICRFLHTNGFTRQKLSRVAVQRNDDIIVTFLSNISLFKREMFVFVDKTGSDKRDCLRKYGYSLRGKPPVDLQLYSRGIHITAIAAMSCSGVIATSIVEDGVDGDEFQKFLEEKLSAVLLPFNGSNPNSIVIMDNASIHHVDGVVALLETLGVLVFYLPPYSPELNPIEELFSKVKSYLKATEHHLNETLETLLLMAFFSITVNDCISWINHAGYK